MTWILCKGNHDITGPGAVDAFQDHYVPMIRKQTGNPEINNASYSYRYDNVQITCIDPWDKETDMLAFLEGELSESNAKYKFVAIHEPVIPVTERCWHTLRWDPEKREKLLEIIAGHKAIVFMRSSAPLFACKTCNSIRTCGAGDGGLCYQRERLPAAHKSDY